MLHILNIFNWSFYGTFGSGIFLALNSNRPLTEPMITKFNDKYMR